MINVMLHFNFVRGTVSATYLNYDALFFNKSQVYVVAVKTIGWRVKY